MKTLEELFNEVINNKKCLRDDIVLLYRKLDENSAYEEFTNALRKYTDRRYYVVMKNDDYNFYDIIESKK